MLRIGPTFYKHTPYARVHSVFLPLFEAAIRQRALPCFCKVTVFCYFPRQRIRRSSDTDMADENDARDRKSVVEGKRVDVRVDIGGSRISRKKNRLRK